MFSVIVVTAGVGLGEGAIGVGVKEGIGRTIHEFVELLKNPMSAEPVARKPVPSGILLKLIPDPELDL